MQEETLAAAISPRGTGWICFRELGRERFFIVIKDGWNNLNASLFLLLFKPSLSFLPTFIFLHKTLLIDYCEMISTPLSNWSRGFSPFLPAVVLLSQIVSAFPSIVWEWMMPLLLLLMLTIFFCPSFQANFCFYKLNKPLTHSHTLTLTRTQIAPCGEM